MDQTLYFKRLAAQIRIALLNALKNMGGGHVGGSLSIVEALAVLYGHQLKHDPKHPEWDQRDYLILSKGHAGVALYAILAIRGYFNETLLSTINQPKTLLPSHPDRLKTPGVDMTNGSLGQGASVAAGIAYALRYQQQKQYVYVIIGDGELNEGQNWEAFSFISHHQLNNCILLIDENKKQLDGPTSDIQDQLDLTAKFVAFGFHTLRVDGKDCVAINQAIDQAKQTSQPTCIILDTIKGQGVPYFETLAANHSVKFGERENAIVDEFISQLSHTVLEDVYV